jgi:tetratricopeptide (TPR) repeat protein
MPTLFSTLRRLFTDPQWRRRALLCACLLLLAPAPWPLALVEDFRVAPAAQAGRNYTAAADALSDAAARLPYVGAVVYQAGLASISAGRYQQAVGQIELASTLDGWTPEKRIALGDAYFGLAKRDAATEQWALALKDRPTDAALLQRLATNYEASGRYTETVAILSSLVALGQATPEMYYRLAALTAAVSPAEALARLEVVIEIAPDRAANARALKAAIEEGQRAHNEAYTLALTGVAFEQLKEWALAEMALSRAVTLSPNLARAYAYLGVAHDELGQDGQADYETALKLEPGSSWTNYLLGNHWRRLGDSRAAINYYQRALALDAANPAFAAELANTYAGLGDLTEAENWFRAAVRLAPQDANFWVFLARFYCDQNYHVAEEGLPAARQAVGLAPNNAAAVDALGCALWLTDDLVNASKAIQRALTLDPKLASAYYHAGQLYLTQGQTADAEVAFNNTLVLDPSGPYGNLAFQALAGLNAASPGASSALPSTTLPAPSAPITP